MTRAIPVETIFLEMHGRPLRNAATPPELGVTVVRAESPTVSFYRYLYRTVGEPWLWYERNALSDEELSAAITAPGIELHVLWVRGVPAGYVELDCKAAKQTQILYFGLVPEFIGRGLGRFFLDWAVDRAFSRPIGRLWVHTCSLDHPRALDTYRRAGFREYDRERGTIYDPPVG